MEQVETLPVAGAPGAGKSLREAKQRVGSNALFNALNYATLTLVTLLVAPLLVHRLGNTAYGVWGLIGELLGYSFLLDFGIRIAVTRYVARHLALDQPREVNSVITNGLAVTVVSALLAVAAGCVFAYYFPRLFSIPPELTTTARLSVVVVILGFAVTFPGSLFSGTLAALSRYDLLGIRNISANLLRALMLWVFLEHGCGLLAVAIITSALNWFAYSLDFLFVSRLLPTLAIRWEYLNRRTLRTLLDFSVYALILSISWRLIFMTDNLVVGFVLGPVAVTFYTVGRTLAGFLRDSLGSITTLYSPLASQMDALGERGGLQRLLTAGSRIALLCALAGIVPLVAVGPRFLGFWMGKAFVEKSGPVLILLAIEVGFWAVAASSGQALYGLNRHKFNAWLSLSNATTNFTLSVILIRWLGAVGVAWGTTIPAVFVEGIILPAYTASLLGTSLLHFYRSAVLRPLVAAVPYAVWLGFCAQQGLVRGYATLILVVGSGLLVYATLGWRLALESDERTWVQLWLVGVRSTVIRSISMAYSALRSFRNSAFKALALRAVGPPKLMRKAPDRAFSSLRYDLEINNPKLLKKVTSMKTIQTQSRILPSLPRRVSALSLALLAGLVLLLYAPTLAYLFHDWWRNPDYSHGFFIPPIAAFFLWRKRVTLRSLPARPAGFGLLVVLGAQALFVLACVGSEPTLQRGSLLLLAAGTVLYLWGWRVLKEVSFALFLLLLAIPLPAIIFNSITMPLQLVASSLAERLLDLAHIPVFREGNLLEIRNQTLNVTEACSGIRSLATLVTGGVIVGYFLPARGWLRPLFVLSSIPIALGVNALRVAGTGVLAETFGERWATGFLHLFSGWVIFIFACCLLLGERQLLERWFGHGIRNSEFGIQNPESVARS